MHSHTPTDRYLRLATVCLFFLTALVFIGPFLDFFGRVQAMLGRINNLSAIICVVYLAMALALPPMLRGPRERLVALSLILALFYATLITFARHHDWLVSFGGLLALYATVSAGLGAYALARSGKGLQTRLVAMMIATLPAMIIPIAMMTAYPDAYKTVWVSVYGYSNVRVMGEFTATCVVVISGIALWALRGKNPLHIAILLAGLSVAWSFLFWTGSRSGMLSALIAIGLTLILIPRGFLAQVGLNTAAIGIGAGLSTLYYTPPGPWFGLFNRIEATTSGLGSGGGVSKSLDAASSGRLDLWAWTWERVLDAPLLGHGYLPMAGLRTPEFNFYHSHNIVLEYLLSFGLIAGALMLLLAGALWVAALMAARRINQPVATSLAMLVILLPVYAMSAAILFFPYHLMLYGTALGTLIGWDLWLQRDPEPEAEHFQPKADWMFDEA